MTDKITVREVLHYLKLEGYEVSCFGDLEIAVDGFCPLDALCSNKITWVKEVQADTPKRFQTYHDCIVVSKKVFPTTSKRVCFIVTAEPKAAFFSILRNFWGDHRSLGEVASTAVVQAKNVAANVSIGHHSYIGADVVIGENTVIEHNVSIYHKVSIGRNCVIHSGTVIGADGFGYFFEKDGCPVKVEHFGGVRIGDDVEIGANVCIDRGTIGDTVISDHTKIDNLVHIAHNVQIGETSMVVAGAIVCGSVKMSRGSYIAPGGIIKNQLSLGENAFVGLGAVVTRPVEADTVVIGMPAKPVRKVRREDK